MSIPVGANNTELTYAVGRLSTDEETSPFLALRRGSRASRASRASGDTKNMIHTLLSNIEEELIPNEDDIEFNKKEDDFEAAAKWLNPYAIENRAIFASYLSVGFGLYFILTPMTFYMVNDLSATATQQAVVTGLMSLPWALKIFCGFLSDSVPIYGMRRKPYFIIGWVLYALCNIILAIIKTPSLEILALFIFLMTTFFVLSDVCTDAIIVERSKAYETPATRGTLQAFGYITRFFGGILGALLGAILYNKSDWGWGLDIWAIFLLNAFFPLLIITPWVFYLIEIKSEVPPSIRVQLAAIWELVQKKAVWLPCSFIFIFNCLLLTNLAWNSFLVDGLNFSNFDLGLLTLAAAILSYFALLLYKSYLFEVSFRHIYLGGTFISFLFSCLQLVI